MKKRREKRCEIGMPASVIRDAMREWKSQQVDAKLMAALPGGWVSKLPKYPEPGTVEYGRCIQKWMNAFMQAQMMDSWLQQMATLQGQIDRAQPILDALTGAYQDCMTGTPV